MNTNPKSTNAPPSDDVHLIVAQDEEVIIEHHPENWIAFVLFWALAFIVFLQFFTRYILNDSLAWTEEIARYGLMWLAFIGGAVVTRKKTQIAVELLGNLMKPGPLRTALFALVDFVTLGFMALLAYFSVIDHRAHADPDHDGVRSADEPRLWRRRRRLLPDAGPADRSRSGPTRARAGARPTITRTQIPAD